MDSDNGFSTYYLPPTIYNLRPTTYDLLPTTYYYGGEHMLSQLFVIVCVPATSFNGKKM